MNSKKWIYSLILLLFFTVCGCATPNRSINNTLIGLKTVEFAEAIPKSETLEKLKELTDVIEPQKLEKLLKNAGDSEFDIIINRLHKDIGIPEFSKELKENGGLVDAWAILKKTEIDGLSGKVDNLESLNKALKQGDYDAAYFENLLKTKSDPQKFIDDYVKKLGDDGKFLDADMETKYTDYLARKSREGKTPRDRADWNHARDYWLNDSPMARGNDFNETAKIERWYPYNEVNLSNGKRLDGYKPPQNGKRGEIVSRKATDLGDIQLSTFESYLSEMKLKYAPGTPINAPKYGNALKGQKLEGDMFLEIPDSNLGSSNIQEYIDLASSKGITLRFKPE